MWSSNFVLICQLNTHCCLFFYLNALPCVNLIHFCYQGFSNTLALGQNTEWSSLSLGLYMSLFIIYFFLALCIGLSYLLSLCYVFVCPWCSKHALFFLTGPVTIIQPLKSSRVYAATHEGRSLKYEDKCFCEFKFSTVHFFQKHSCVFL